MNNIEKTLTLNIEKIKKAAHKYKEENPSLTYTQALQKVSVILFDKPYEEIKKTLLDKQQEKNSVIIVEYGSESILTLNGEYVSQCCVGTDMEIPISKLESMAESLACANNTKYHRVFLPVVLKDSFETEDILSLAKYMGYFNEQNIFDEIESSDTTIIVNDMLSPYKFDGDWENEIADSVESDEDYRDFCLWHIETEKGYDKYEFFISFKELCEAKQINNNTWIINYENLDLKVEIKR